MRDVLRSGLCRLVACLLAVVVPAVAFAHPGGVDKDFCHLEKKTGIRHCHPVKKSSLKYDDQRPPLAGDEGVFFGPLVGVIDGDTLIVKIQGVDMDFRLAEIDAPEKDQPYGDEAKRELLSLVAGQQIVLVPVDTDHYGRTVAKVWVGKLYVNRALVQCGVAWFLSDYTDDNSLQLVEDDARAAKRGLWALSLERRVEPWEWRRRKGEHR